MRRVFLIIAAIAAIVLLLATVGPYLIPNSTFRDMIQDSLRAGLDARVEIEEFKFKIVPYPGYTIKGLRLISNEAPFKGMTLFYAEKVNGTLSFASLIRGAIETDLDIRGATIDIKFSQGVSNIGTMLKLEKPGDVQAVPSVPALLAPTEPQPAAPSEEIGAQPESESQPQSESGTQQQPESEPESKPESKPEPAPESEPESAPESAPQPGFRSMPAPSIDAPSSWNFMPWLVRDAMAADGNYVRPRRPINVGKIDIIRAEVTIDSDSLPQPILISQASFSLKDIYSEPTLGMDIRASGILGSANRSNFSARASISIDQSKREVSATKTSAFFNGSQFAGEFTLNYGATPASLDIHVASPNLVPAAAWPMLALMGRLLPEQLTWNGTVALDARYKGVKSAGEIQLNIDARAATLALGPVFKKDQGSPFKVSLAGTLTDAALAIASGTVTIESTNFSISGEVKRDQGITSMISLSAIAVDPGAMTFFTPGLLNVVDLGPFNAGIDLLGELASAIPMKISGNIDSPKASVVGISVNDVSATFEKEPDALSLTSLKGEYAAGTLSGTGVITTGAQPGMEFDVVTHEVDTSAIKSLGGVISGKAELVTNMSSNGTDQYALTNNLKMSGTLIAAEFAGPLADAVRTFLSEETINQIAAASAQTLVATALPKPGVGPEEASELRAGFEISSGLISSQEVSWKGKDYTANVSASADPTSSLKGEGEIVINADLARKIAADPVAQKALLEKDGRLIVPVELAGRLAKPEFKFMDKKFLDMMQASQRIKEKQVATETEKKTEAAAKTATEAKTKPAPEATQKPKPPAAKPKQAPGAKSGAAAPVENVDDMLKVIVGE